MLSVLMFFYLLSPPAPLQICALWLSQPASAQDVEAACPAGIALEEYQVDFVNIWNEKVYCSANATAVYVPYVACGFTESLDNFRMEINKPPAGPMLLCCINSYTNPPKRAEIAAACSWDALAAYDAGRAELRYMGVVEIPEPVVVEIPAPQPGPGLYDQPASAAELATSERLAWLAGRLIWHGLIQPECEGGYSGLDPLTLAADECGLQAAAPLMADWQNQFDAEIYAAALTEGVPARLLKRVIRVESQYWPLWGSRPEGETGLAQITAMGADTYLRWYVDGYAYSSEGEQQATQAAFLASLNCGCCDINQAVQKERENIPIYARILKAYRYASPDWRAALVLWNGDDYAVKIEQQIG